MLGPPSRLAEPFTASARELELARPVRFRVRARLRRAALTGLAVRPRTRRDGVRIVHYHWVFDDEREQFRRQLVWLAREFEPVALSDAVERLRAGRASGREVVVTFDDGFRTQATNAAPLLVEAGIQSCFFVITSLVSALPDEAKRICRERLHLPRPVEPMTWDDVNELLELGHEVGSHTRTHANLAMLDEAALADELAGSRAELEQRLARPPRHVSAPYGERDRFSPAVSAAARAAGYESCATAQRGRNHGPDDVYALRRDHLVAGWPLRDLRYFLA